MILVIVIKKEHKENKTVTFDLYQNHQNPPQSRLRAFSSPLEKRITRVSRRTRARAVTLNV